MLDGAKTLLPFQGWLRRVKRRLTPYADTPANTDLAITQGLRQISMLRAASVDLCADVLEIGSGWLPVIPLLFRLAGARSLTLTDIERLMDAHTNDLARRAVAARAVDVAAALRITEAAVHAGLADPFAPRYLAPWQPERTPSASADIIVSRAVFEHIPAADLKSLMFQCRRIIRPSGAMCHAIDNSDHWQHRDKRLSRINMLRYDEASLLWRLACLNPQNYQNRLRHSDYSLLFRETGWRVMAEDGEVDRGALQDAAALPLAPRFRGMPAADLATITSWFVVRPDHGTG